MLSEKECVECMGVFGGVLLTRDLPTEETR
jgi:hypothetical protein